MWILDSPHLSQETKNDYIKFVDSVIRVDFPNEEKEPELHRLVSQYQIHKHSNSCRKYKNVPCRFNYGRYFTEKTIIAEPSPTNLNENGKGCYTGSES